MPTVTAFTSALGIVKSKSGAIALDRNITTSALRSPLMSSTSASARVGTSKRKVSSSFALEPVEDAQGLPLQVAVPTPAPEFEVCTVPTLPGAVGFVGCMRSTAVRATMSRRACAPSLVTGRRACAHTLPAVWLESGETSPSSQLKRALTFVTCTV